MINLSTNKAFIERSVQFQEEPLVAIEVGVSSSPIDPLTVSGETNEFADFDMYNNDDLISDPESPTRPKWAVFLPFTHLGHMAEIFKPLGVSLGESLELRLSPCS